MENKKNKCDKFEAFFVFQDGESLLNHLKECPDCREEYEKQMKISSLVKDAADVYKERAKKKKDSLLKRAACFFVLFIGLTTITGYGIYDNYSLSKYDPSSDYSYNNNYDMPTDEYGFIEI